MLSNTQKTFDISLDKEMKVLKDKQNVYPSPGAYNIVNSEIMSSSTHSLSSSLASPGDSGVQLLDSESDMASLMSMSGHDFIDKTDDTDMIRSVDEEDEDILGNSHRISVILNKDFQVVNDVKNHKAQDIVGAQSNELLQVDTQNLMTTSDIVNQNTTPPTHDWKIYSQSAPTDFMKHSRADVTHNIVEEAIEDKSVVEKEESNLQDLDSETKVEKPLTPPPTESEQVETTADNNEDIMQTSIIAPMIDDQIVYRRQRRKKIKSQDTPKKRVSFHEDILNSTKIDDIHIDRGFITRQCSDGFYNEHTLHKNGIVLGRYSWAAEGDSSCYNRNNVYERDVKSDIITNGGAGTAYLAYSQQQNIISNSSSSSMSLDDSSCSSSTSSSSIDGDFKDDGELGGIINGIQNIKKVPKSSCLKKPKHGVIDTKIVHENTNSSRRSNLSRKISESNLLDTNNIFGSLKNIYKTLSSSVPLTQRGVPEGQEDFTAHSEYSYGNSSKRNSYSGNETLFSKSLDTSSYLINNVHDVVTEEPVTEIIESSDNSLMMTSVVEHRPIKIYKKPNLRLSRSEGFYPNYPYDQQQQQQCEQNIIVCDSNVYEHRGISYSYEYDQFQSTFQNDTNQASTSTAAAPSTNATGSNKKSSTIYQMLLDELNFLKRSESKTSSTTITPTTSPLFGGDSKINQQQQQSSATSVTNSVTSTPVKKQQSGKMQSSIHSDWSSDTESISDIYDKSIQSTTASSKHLQSPLKKRNLKPNHYSIQKSSMLTLDNNDLKALTSSTPINNTTNATQSSSKTSLINRFLRNVTQRKLFETKLNQQITNKFFNKNFLLNLYNIDRVQPNQELCDQLNIEIRQEIEQYQHGTDNKCNKEGVVGEGIEKKQKYEKIKEKIMRQTAWCQQSNGEEMNFYIYKVQSAYNMIGENKPILLLITNTILFIFSLNNDKYYNEFMIPLKEIHFILIGPNQQTIYITNNRQTLIYFIITGDSQLTQDIISRLEFIIRTQNNNATTINYQLPSIKQFAFNDMIQLRYAIYQQTSVAKDEDFYHYNLVHIEDEQLLTASTKDTTPLGPYHDGFLMYRTAQTEDRWQFGYFILKAGVLYMFPSPTTRIPIKVIQLYDGECYGVHRTPPRPRPHTFELFTKTESLEFAASDEYEASDWLQVFVQSASGTQVVNDIKQPLKQDENQQSTTSACSLILTSEHLVTVRECFNFNQQQNQQQHDSHESATSKHNDGGIQTLSCAAISDLTSFKIPSSASASSSFNDDQQQSWCILEFSCREVSETSGDWILYFSTFFELNQFLSTFEVLWSYTNTQGDKFPLMEINETDNIIYRHASETYHELQQAWISFQ